MRDKKIILLGSGGLDTQMSMGILNDQGYDIETVYFDYGQATRKTEIPALKKYTKSILGKEPHVKSISEYMNFIKDSWAVKGSPEDTFDDKEKIFIPGRNIVFLLYASIMGYYSNIYELCLSLHKSDSISGDCKPAFTKSFSETLSLGLSTPRYPVKFKIVTPLADMEKWEAIQIGDSLGLNFSESWSCDDSKEAHCGVCLQCKERKYMFEKAEIEDTVVYLQ